VRLASQRPVRSTGWSEIGVVRMTGEARAAAVRAKRPLGGSSVSSRGRGRLLPWEVSGQGARH
jgi:hypothetical protein